ncbi:hypothetical protein BJ741DRAFT_706849 [Chytriomyces cf. hyalinus JEL632]|nr:hypothetical protein BJ741DRAFT_706849 [Chytriomyces cf. hyalinus JEL632]
MFNYFKCSKSKQMSEACLAAQSKLISSIDACGIGPDASPSTLTPIQAQCLCALTGPLSAVSGACSDEPNVLETALSLQQYCASRTGNEPSQQSPFPSFVNPLNSSGNIARPTATVSEALSSAASPILSASRSQSIPATATASPFAQSNATSAACASQLTKLINLPTDACFIIKGSTPTAGQVTCYCNQAGVMMKELSEQCEKDPAIEAFKQNYSPICLLVKSDAYRVTSSFAGAAVSAIWVVAFLF